MERHFVICDCGSCEHQIMFSYLPGDDEGLMFVEPHLATWQNLPRRLWVAIRYVLGHKSRYGAWDELVLGHDEVRDLCGFLSAFL